MAEEIILWFFAYYSVPLNWEKYWKKRSSIVIIKYGYIFEVTKYMAPTHEMIWSYIFQLRGWQKNVWCGVTPGIAMIQLMEVTSSHSVVTWCSVAGWGGQTPHKTHSFPDQDTRASCNLSIWCLVRGAVLVPVIPSIRISDYSNTDKSFIIICFQNVIIYKDLV